MASFQVKKVSEGKVSLLHKTDDLALAKEYALAWSNENNFPCLIFGKREDRALMFTHRVSDNNYQIYR